MPPPVEAYHRVWLAFGQTPAEHEKFHSDLWRGSDPARVAKAITDRVAASPAEDADKEAVTAHLSENWQESRVLASLASCASCWGGENFPARLRSLREAAGLNGQELADLASLSRQRLHQLESGTHKPTWAEVQQLAAALKVPTDTFRDA